MQKITYTCDICGKQKGEANHWFIYKSARGFSSLPWETGYPHEIDDSAHACGLACLHTAMDRALTQKAE